jgi:hypothetical protein
MRLPGSEELEIIRLVEQSHLPARRTLEMLGVRPSTFYRWYIGIEPAAPKRSKICVVGATMTKAQQKPQERQCNWENMRKRPAPAG